MSRKNRVQEPETGYLWRKWRCEAGRDREEKRLETLLVFNEMATLRAFWARQKRVLSDLHDEMMGIQLGDRQSGIYLGYCLHGFYCGIEEFFQQVAAAFENHIDSLAGYHRQLLVRMTLDLPGIRPAVVSEKTFAWLEDLRGFRHVFRHAYMAMLDSKRLHDLRRSLKKQWPVLQRDIGSLDRYLQTLIES